MPIALAAVAAFTAAVIQRITGLGFVLVLIGPAVLICGAWWLVWPGLATPAGAAAGFMHVARGLSAPPPAAHAVGDRWPQRSFAASVQAIFAWIGAAVVLVRVRFALAA